VYVEDAENWATVPGFPHYKANRLGMIQRVDTGIILKPFTRRRASTQYVRLYTTPGEAHEKSVASVVWAAFYKRWPTGSYVCHLDGDIANNKLDNLFLGSRVDALKSRRRQDDIIWARLQEEGELTL
jgi:hypothetical protein